MDQIIMKVASSVQILMNWSRQQQQQQQSSSNSSSSSSRTQVLQQSGQEISTYFRDDFTRFLTRVIRTQKKGISVSAKVDILPLLVRLSKQSQNNNNTSSSSNNNNNHNNAPTIFTSTIVHNAHVFSVSIIKFSLFPSSSSSPSSSSTFAMTHTPLQKTSVEVIPLELHTVPRQLVSQRSMEDEQGKLQFLSKNNTTTTSRNNNNNNHKSSSSNNNNNNPGLFAQNNNNNNNNNDLNGGGTTEPPPFRMTRMPHSSTVGLWDSLFFEAPNDNNDNENDNNNNNNQEEEKLDFFDKFNLKEKVLRRCIGTLEFSSLLNPETVCIPCAVLFRGPPGGGKTTLARALAHKLSIHHAILDFNRSSNKNNNNRKDQQQQEQLQKFHFSSSSSSPLQQQEEEEEDQNNDEQEEREGENDKNTKSAPLPQLPQLAETIFLEINAAGLMSKYLGDSAKLIYKQFAFIRAALVSNPHLLVVVAIDEIESLAISRSISIASGEPVDGTRCINCLLNELEDIKKLKNVFFFFTTNLDKQLDEAFVSRLDSVVTVPRPSKNVVLKILANSISQLIYKKVVSLPSTLLLVSNSTSSSSSSQQQQQQENNAGDANKENRPDLRRARSSSSSSSSSSSFANHNNEGEKEQQLGIFELVLKNLHQAFEKETFQEEFCSGRHLQRIPFEVLCYHLDDRKDNDNNNNNNNNNNNSSSNNVWVPFERFVQTLKRVLS